MERNPLGFAFYKEHPSDELISKRRKLSELSNASDSTGEKHELNESFKRLELGNLTHSADQFKSMPNLLPNQFLQISLPIKPVAQKPIQNQQQSILQGGIQKYLRLGDDFQDASEMLRQPYQQLQKLFENQQQVKLEDNHHECHELKKPPPSFFAYGIPTNFEALKQEAIQILQNEMQLENQRQQKRSDNQKLDQILFNSDPDMIGKLTKEQRAEKVRMYLEKKHNRQWLAVRYTQRKHLADQRDRVQGRFIKSDKPRFNQSFVNSLSNSDVSLKKEIKERKQNSLNNSYVFNNSS